jgi:3-oxoacyl-[acyl-carrier protein] reductase
VSKKLAGKVAIVTGASKGIGASVSRYLAAAGASVVVNYASDQNGAEKVVKEIEQEGRKAIAVKANMTNQGEIKRLFSEAKKAFGKIDILINNAGVYSFFPIEELTPEKFHKQFDLNVLGLLLATQEAVAYFGDSGGCIINMSSIASTASTPTGSVYCATKAAVDAITRTLCHELGPRKIRVNSVNPGMVETEGTHSTGIMESDFRKNVESLTPLGRIGEVKDIAPAVVFLSSDEASWISGETFFISGGFRGL